MVHAKTVKGNVLIGLLAVVVCFSSVCFKVSAAYGTVRDWDGLVGVVYPSPVLYLDCRSDSYYEYDETKVVPDSSFVVYSGEGNVRLNVSGTTIGSYLNGSMHKRIKVAPGTATTGYSSVKYLTASCDPVVLNGISISLSTVSYAPGGSLMYDIFVQFDNYYVSSSELVLPLNIKHTMVMQYDFSSNYYISPVMAVTPSIVADYAGSVMEYTDIRDTPTVDGDFAVQNQEMIDGLSQGNQLQTQGNQLQQQENQLQTQGNKLQEEQNKLQEEQNKQEKNFFDNFFDNMSNTVMSWIIPSSEQLTAFLDEVNDWFGDRLGFIWYPFDLAIDMVSALAKGNANSKLKIPALTLDMLGSKYTIWNAMEIEMDAFGIFQYVRFFTSVIVVGGVIRLAAAKWDSWIGGRHG